MSKKSEKLAATPEMYDVILRPIVTEKSTMASEHGKIAFLVRPEATKRQIKQAVEALFSVEVTKVNTLKKLGKNKRFKGIKGKRPDFKKTLVTLKEGQTVDVMAGVK